MADATPAAVFLSYASQDAPAVLRIAEALRAAGVEVWFDQNELVGGDAWDQKIRRQIKECALFVPVISANTQARTEGYFRLEWRLADQRTHLMAKGRPFLLPVVIDATRDAEAHVPDSFTEVQWTRLPGGETTPAFCARVKKLLGGSDGERASRPVGLEGTDREVRAPARPAPSRPWLVPAILGVAAVGVLALWQPWRAKEKSAPPAATATTPSAPITEAQQLVAKAQKVFDEGDDLSRETYTLAEEFLVKAETLDPSEVSAWSLHARLSMLRYAYSLDRTTARREALRAQADRAARLAPGSLEARLANGYARYIFDQFSAWEPEGRDLAAKFPNDWRAQQMLGRALVRLGKADEALAYFNRALQLRPDDPAFKSDVANAYFTAARFVESQDYATRALQGRTNARLLAMGAFFGLVWNGDLTSTTEAIGHWPPWFMQEDRGAACATLVALWRGDDTRALEVTGQFPRDYLRDFYFTGPRAVLSAWAHEHAGHTASAQAEWRTVLQVTERELKSAPDDAASLHWKAWALARLGETGPAAEILRQLEESYPDFNGNLNGLPHVAGGFGGLALALGRKDEALAQIARVKLNPALNIRPLTKTILHLNPVFDPLRSDPRFQALIDAALGPEEKKENKPTSAVAPAVSEKSLVVLPLENLSPDPENAFFTDGMHAEIISTLGQIADLKVVSRNSALAFKGSTAPLAEIAQKLGVANVLTGSVRRAGNTARIQLELRRASDEALLWSLPKGDRELKDVLGLQSEVADQVARVLQARADKGIYAGAQLMTKDPQAYDAYLKAMNLYLTDRSEAASQEVILLMDAALQRDSKFMLAAKLIARTHCRIALTTHDLLVRSSHAIEAKKWAETASGLMPGGGGDAMLAQYYSTVERDFLKALGYGENAIRALPGDLDGHNFAGTALIGLGRTEEALAKFETCLRLDPRSLPNWNNLLRTLASLRRREAFDKTMVEALAAYASSATEVPQWSTYRYALTGELPAKLEGLTPQEQAAWLWRSRRFEEQARVLTEEQRQPQLLDLDRLSGLCALHDALIRVQRPAEAETCARQALALAEKLQSAAEVGPTEKPGWMAIALMRVGRDDEALAAARRYVEATSATNQALMRWDREVVLAELYARLHRPRECVELLAKLLHVGSCGLSVNTRVLSVHTLRVDPIWDNVREDPAFKALLADPKNSAPL